MNSRLINTTLLTLTGLAFAALATACGSDDGQAQTVSSPTPVTMTVTETATSVTTTTPRTTARVETTAPAETEIVRTSAPAQTGSGLSVSQRNAVAKGRDYLGLSAFSRTGLIEQLSFEGFSSDDATVAVDYLSPDWTAQARKKAAEYMKLSAFSEQGLLDQLVFEGFTQQQAAAGAASQF